MMQRNENERLERNDLVAKGIDELICRSLNEQPSDFEAAQLSAWRRSRPENEEYYRDLVFMLDATRAAAAEAANDTPPSVGEIVERASSAPEISGRWRRRRGWAAGFALALAAGIAVLLVAVPAERPANAPPLRITGDPGSFSLSTTEILTRAGESTTVALSDGSVVRLAPESRLRVTGRTDARELWLDGRAYFAVSSDPSQPFRIRTHLGDAVVLGTRFDLQARNEDLRVLVVEGAVTLSARGSELTVGASELARVGADNRAVREVVDTRTLQRELEWLEGFIAFENTPLEQVARELSARYGVSIEILDDDLAAATVRGMFNSEPLDDVIDVVCRAVGASCQISPTRVTIGL